MKRRVLFSLLLLAGLAGPLNGAWAQARWRELPPDERRQMRQQMREHWQQDREMRREDGPRRWADVPPEDRRRLREEMREQRGVPVPYEGRGWRRD